MTPTTNLANAGRRLIAQRAGEGLDTLEHELSKALDEYDAQELLKIDVQSRLDDKHLRQIMREELDAEERANGKFEDGFGPVVDAGLKAMQRVANYADHLRSVMILLAANADLEGLIYQVRDSEQLGWEGPRVKAVGEAVAEILSEVNAGPTPPEQPLGHA